MNCDAENRSRNAIVAPDDKAGRTIAFSALPWNNGIAQYKTSSFVDQVELVAARAARPCVIRTAFGAPVDPDVKIKTQRSSACTGGGCTGAAAARRSRHAAPVTTNTAAPPTSSPARSGAREASHNTAAQ